MRLFRPRRLFPVFALALAAGCQGSPPPPAPVPPTAAATSNPIIACERGCSAAYDACMDAPPVSGGRSSPVLSAQGAGEICPDQLKACLRRCLN